MDNLSKFDETYKKFLEINKLNDIAISSKIFIKDYNRGHINKESIKSEFKFGWFSFYSIKNKIKNIFKFPKSICYFHNEKNLDEKKYNEYYEFKYHGFKYFINNILKDIHYEMKNNLEHIIQLKSENFEKIKDNVNDFIKIYIDIFDSFDSDEDDDENKNI